MAKEIPGYRLIGQGYNVVPVGRRTATAKNVTDPKGVIALLAEPHRLKDTIIVTPGGTTTFLAPLLYRNIGGIITFAGAPESHLGIVGRNFRVPIVMTIKLEEGNSIPDGTTLLMDCSEGKIGYVYAQLASPPPEQSKPGVG